MSILDTFQKNFDSLKSDFIEYKDYHDTMITVIPSILELLDSLFLEENIKGLNNYKLLKEDYLDVIKRTLDPNSYKDVKFEADLPDIYDAPRMRKAKAKRITQLKAKKVNTLPARIQEKRLEPSSSSLPSPIPTVNQNLNPSLNPKIDKALQSYAQEGKKLYNYPSPLKCENQNTQNTFSQEFPDKILVELPDESRAYLFDNGLIFDTQCKREIGKIDESGTIILNNSKLGKIDLVNRDIDKYSNLTNNFGRPTH